MMKTVRIEYINNKKDYHFFLWYMYKYSHWHTKLRFIKYFQLVIVSFIIFYTTYSINTVGLKALLSIPIGKFYFLGTIVFFVIVLFSESSEPFFYINSLWQKHLKLPKHIMALIIRENSLTFEIINNNSEITTYDINLNKIKKVVLLKQGIIFSYKNGNKEIFLPLPKKYISLSDFSLICHWFNLAAPFY